MTTVHVPVIVRPSQRCEMSQKDSSCSLPASFSLDDFSPLASSIPGSRGTKSPPPPNNILPTGVPRITSSNVFVIRHCSRTTYDNANVLWEGLLLTATNTSTNSRPWGNETSDRKEGRKERSNPIMEASHGWGTSVVVLKSQGTWEHGKMQVNSSYNRNT